MKKMKQLNNLKYLLMLKVEMMMKRTILMGIIMIWKMKRKNLSNSISIEERKKTK
jgi:hypothetical protein